MKAIMASLVALRLYDQGWMAHIMGHGMAVQDAPYLDGRAVGWNEIGVSHPRIMHVPQSHYQPCRALPHVALLHLPDASLHHLPCWHPALSLSPLMCEGWAVLGSKGLYMLCYDYGLLAILVRTPGAPGKRRMGLGIREYLEGHSGLPGCPEEGHMTPEEKKLALELFKLLYQRPTEAYKRGDKAVAGSISDSLYPEET